MTSATHTSARPASNSLLHSLLRMPVTGEENVRTQSLLDALVADAVAVDASDIHLDPGSDGYRLRFRTDGMVTDQFPIALHEGRRLVRAVKGLANLDLTAKPLPQDGRVDFQTGNGHLSLRIAVVPTVRGDKITLRLPRPELSKLTLRELGLSEADYHLLRGVVEDAQGMVLVSGPTGAGKTTTLYALVHELKQKSQAIITVEDPVEYLIDGISQIQVDERRGLTFAEGVRGLLRLDPDVILMGEMRDAASAKAALDAADSGHVFLSTLHARDAAGTITALRNFGLRDHEIAATVDVIVAQRLVRRLCPTCRQRSKTRTEDVHWLEFFGQKAPKENWYPVGCPQCQHSGYRGRAGIFEVWRLHEEEADLILKHADEHTLRRRLRRQGTLSLLEDDLHKVSEGITSLAEIQSLGGFGFYSRRMAQSKIESVLTE